MINPIKKSLHFFLKLERQIAFYPSVLALAGLLLALVMMYFEQRGLSQMIVKHVPIVMVQSFDTARTILGTFIGGFISILVFSFSMVMILLNQAAANFSPRLLPGLVSNKKHQIILGIYLGSLFFCLLALMMIEPGDQNLAAPGSMILMAILMMATSLTAFLYFIHSISQSIQVEHILRRIYTRAERQFNRLLDNKDIEIQGKTLSDTPPDDFSPDSDWHTYGAKNNGYLSAVDSDALIKLMQENNNQLQVLVGRSYYMLAETPLFKTRQPIDDDLLSNIHNQFLIEASVSVEDNEDLGFKLITEIAIKAMSPGINDPGTALSCIDYLTQLLALRLRHQPLEWLKDKVKEEDKENTTPTTRLQLKPLDFDDLLFQVMAPFRTYCAHDTLISLKLLHMHVNLLQLTPANCEQQKSLIHSAQLLNQASQKQIMLSADQDRIQSLFDSINQ
jgi:uncharacterized membrane protein